MVVHGLHIQRWLARSVECPIDCREDRALALQALVNGGRSHARRQGRDQLCLLDASPERVLARLIEEEARRIGFCLVEFKLKLFGEKRPA